MHKLNIDFRVSDSENRQVKKIRKRIGSGYFYGILFKGTTYINTGEMTPSCAYIKGLLVFRYEENFFFYFKDSMSVSLLISPGEGCILKNEMQGMTGNFRNSYP